jgi:hypothetical protein
MPLLVILIKFGYIACLSPGGGGGRVYLPMLITTCLAATRGRAGRRQHPVEVLYLGGAAHLTIQSKYFAGPGAFQRGDKAAHVVVVQNIRHVHLPHLK